LSARAVYEAFERLGVQMPAELAADQRVFEADEDAQNERLTPELGALVARLWAHPEVTTTSIYL